METFYSDYNMKNKKDKNHIQSKYCKLRTCLESGKMEGNGSLLARAYKVWIETIIFYDGVGNGKFDKKNKYDINETLECFGLSPKYFTGTYYKGDFKNIPVFYTLKKLPLDKNTKIQIHKIKEEDKNKKIIKQAKKTLENKKQKIKIEVKKEEKKEISESDKKFLKQVENLKNKCEILQEKNNNYKDKILNTEIDFKQMKKEYHRTCHYNNQLSLLKEMTDTDLREKLKRMNEDMEIKINDALQKLSEA